MTTALTVSTEAKTSSSTLTARGIDFASITPPVLRNSMIALLPRLATVEDRHGESDGLYKAFFDGLPYCWKRAFLACHPVADIVLQFDAFIIEMAEPHGIALISHPSVRFRLEVWEDNTEVRAISPDDPMEVKIVDGLELQRRFYNSILLGQEVRRGLAQGTLTPRIKYGKTVLCAELKVMAKQLRSFERAHRRAPALTDLLKLAESEPDTFRETLRMFGALTKYAQWRDGAETDNAINQFLAGATTPARFADRLIAWSLNRSYKSIGNDLSEVAEVQFYPDQKLKSLPQHN